MPRSCGCRLLLVAAVPPPGLGLRELPTEAGRRAGTDAPGVDPPADGTEAPGLPGLAEEEEVVARQALRRPCCCRTLRASLWAEATTPEMGRRLVPEAGRRRRAAPGPVEWPEWEPCPGGPCPDMARTPPAWPPGPPPPPPAWPPAPPPPLPSMEISPSSPFCLALASFWKYFWAWVRICTTVLDLMREAIFFQPLPCCSRP